MRKTNPGEARVFFEKALQATTDHCIDWPFTSNKKGHYGLMKVDGQHRRVNRLVCAHVHGEAPSSLHQAAHSCGNDRCINPRHLRWATPKENTEDKIAHGTILYGERNPQSKLTAEDVRQIRSMRKNMTATAIARQFGISLANVSLITTGRAWRSVQ